MRCRSWRARQQALYPRRRSLQRSPESCWPVLSRSSNIANTACHEYGAENEQDNPSQLHLNDRANHTDLAIINMWKQSVLQSLSPRQKFAGGIDGQQSDHRKERHLREKRHRVEVVGRALFKIEDAKEPNHKHDAC